MGLKPKYAFRLVYSPLKFQDILVILSQTNSGIPLAGSKLASQPLRES